MKMPLFIIVRVWIFVLIIFCCHTRSSDASFSNVGVGPRAIGMGGAFTAVADDAFAPFWNPAGLVQLGHAELATMRLYYPVESVNSDLVSLAWPIPKIPWSATLATSYLGTGETDLYQEKVLLVSYGQDLYDWIKLPLAVGISVKKLIVNYENYDPMDPLFRISDRASGFSVSSGLIFQYSPNLKLALVFDNISSSNLSINQEEESDQNSNSANIGRRFGLTWTSLSHSLLVSAEIAHEKFTQSVSVIQPRIGIERWFWKWVAVRAGVNIPNISTKQAINLTGGFSCRPAVSEIIGMQLDYALSYFDLDQSSLGNYHRVSLSFAF